MVFKMAAIVNAWIDAMNIVALKYVALTRERAIKYVRECSRSSDAKSSEIYEHFHPGLGSWKARQKA